jgi:hypothetical protein
MLAIATRKDAVTVEFHLENPVLRLRRRRIDVASCGDRLAGSLAAGAAAGSALFPRLGMGLP